MYIDEITYLDEIFDLEKKIEHSEHIKITNVSYWNPSNEFKEYLHKHIELTCPQDIFDYIYTYDVAKIQRAQILKKLGVINPDSAMCLLNATGTNSILNVINYLKLHNYQKIAILIPSYFSVEKSCQLYGLAYKKVMLQHYNGKYYIPIEELLKNNFDAIWITSPPYSTGVSFEDSQIDILKKLISKKILVIADETLALPHQMLLTQIPISDFFFCICSPHKPLFMNKLKFSALVCPKKNDDFLEQWIDVLSGSLLSSNIAAIQHFLSNNYDDCVYATQNWYTNSLHSIRTLLQLFPKVQCNLDEIAPYKTIYINCPKKDMQSLKNINTLISKNYASYIPTVMEKDIGFRINLSLETNNLIDTTYKIIKFYS